MKERGRKRSENGQLRGKQKSYRIQTLQHFEHERCVFVQKKGGETREKVNFKQLRLSCREVGSSERDAGWSSSCIIIYLITCISILWIIWYIS